MTVAAVILAATPASALADADGTAAVRRLADAAWAGGATPVVVCAPDPDGAVAAVLATTEVTLSAPVAADRGPVGQIAAGIDAAVGLVAATDGVLVWPARLAWVDAETVTTLISAHGADREALLRPAFRGEPGFPALVPVTALAILRALGADRLPGDLLDDLAAAGVAVRLIDTGDPGVTHDIGTARGSLPAYDGPPEPEDGVMREWGAGGADEPDHEPTPRDARPAPPDPA
jgi:CTP:molybdopterin cytidylyltransferase MocA